MPNYTPNYNLKKPLPDESYNVADQNGNMDILDGALKPTANPALVPTGLIGKISEWVSWITNRIKAITGKANWYDAPDTTLAAAKTHIDATSAHSATSAATASRIMVRDANGRAKVAAPVEADDIARKNEVDAKQNTITGSASSIVTSNLLSNKALGTDGNGKVAASVTTVNELGYLSGVTSSVQTQLNNKLAASQYTAANVLAKLLTVDGAGSGLDADMLGGLYASAFMQDKRVYGSVSYTDTMAADTELTKYIPLGTSLCKRGMLRVKAYGTSLQGHSIVFFDTNNMHAISVGHFIGNSTVSVIWKEFTTDPATSGMAPAGEYSNLKEIYISGSNLVLVFRSWNTEHAMNFRGGWEVW